MTDASLEFALARSIDLVKGRKVEQEKLLKEMLSVLKELDDMWSSNTASAGPDCPQASIYTPHTRSIWRAIRTAIAHAEAK